MAVCEADGGDGDRPYSRMFTAIVWKGFSRPSSSFHLHHEVEVNYATPAAGLLSSLKLIFESVGFVGSNASLMDPWILGSSLHTHHVQNNMPNTFGASRISMVPQWLNHLIVLGSTTQNLQAPQHAFLLPCPHEWSLDCRCHLWECYI